jgi:hypothetical protein
MPAKIGEGVGVKAAIAAFGGRGVEVIGLFFLSSSIISATVFP